METKYFKIKRATLNNYLLLATTVSLHNDISHTYERRIEQVSHTSAKDVEASEEIFAWVSPKHRTLGRECRLRIYTLLNITWSGYNKYWEYYIDHVFLHRFVENEKLDCCQIQNKKPPF